MVDRIFLFYFIFRRAECVLSNEVWHVYVTISLIFLYGPKQLLCHK